MRQGRQIKTAVHSHKTLSSVYLKKSWEVL